MKDQFLSISCPVLIINGMAEHVHCLFLLNPQKSIAEVIKQIKGSTSHWVNEQDLMQEKFTCKRDMLLLELASRKLIGFINILKIRNPIMLKLPFQVNLITLQNFMDSKMN